MASAGALGLVAFGLGGCGGSSEKVSATTVPPTTASSSVTTTSVTTTSVTTTGTAQIAGLEVVHLAAGDQHACAVSKAGPTFCWGYNGKGQLGDGTTTDHLSPVKVNTDQQFTRVVSGRYFSCGLVADGRAFCWGDNSSGQLGNGQNGGGGDSANSAMPVAVGGAARFTSLTAGQLHVCGLTSTGEAHCWGAYASGQLGNGASGAQSTPGRSADSIVLTSLALGGDTHTCGVDDKKAGWCWGNDTFGQRGTGTKTNAAQHVPAAVKGAHTFSSLTLGRTFTCGIDAAGAAWCWGDNRRGQLGDGTTAEHLEPVAVAGNLHFASLTAGDAHACGVLADGSTRCWGSNDNGQIGDGASAGTRPLPTATAGSVKFTAVSAGEEFTCGVGTDSLAYCWGSNRVGWLGDGTETPHASPAPVKKP